MILWTLAMVAAFVLGRLAEDGQSTSRSAASVGLLVSLVVLLVADVPRELGTFAGAFLGYFISIVFAYVLGTLELVLDD